MSEFKHTPGPWVAALDHNSRPIVWGPGTWQIADGWHTPDGNGWANARLIAASPDLLGALQGLMSISSYMDQNESPSEYAAARAAIAKATGGEL